MLANNSGSNFVLILIGAAFSLVWLWAMFHHPKPEETKHNWRILKELRKHEDEDGSA